MKKYDLLILSLKKFCDLYDLNWVEVNIFMQRNLIAFQGLSYSDINSHCPDRPAINDGWLKTIEGYAAEVSAEIINMDLMYDRYDRCIMTHENVEIRIHKCK